MGKLWLPDVKVVRSQDAGTFTGGGWKICLHTTEGSSIEVAERVLIQAGACPHLLVGPRGQTRQFIPFNRAARALEHPSGPETNRANCIQIEMVGFAKDTQDWSDVYYNRILHVCKQIERNVGVPHRCSVDFNATAASGAQHLSGEAFVRYAGYIGHCHVPGNTHWDPGKFRINKILKG